MTKKALIVFGILAMVFVLAGCGSKSGYEANTAKVKLGKYKGLTYELASTEVTEKDMQERIDAELQSAAEAKELKEGKVEDGYSVDLTYKGTVGGKKFDGCEAVNYVATVGYSGLPFDDKLKGMDIGKEQTITITLPKDYQDKKAAGKKAEYKVTVNSATKYNPPEYDDKFVNSKGYKSKQAYEDALKKELEESKKQSAITSAKENLLAQAIANAEITEMPRSLMDAEYEKTMKQYKEMAKQYDMSCEDFLATYVKSSEEDLETSIRVSSEATARDKLVIAAIADKENIKSSGKEYEEYTQKILKDAGLTEEDFEKQYQQKYSEYCEENDFPSQYLRQKVSDLIYKAGKKK